MSVIITVGTDLNDSSAQTLASFTTTIHHVQRNQSPSRVRPNYKSIFEYVSLLSISLRTLTSTAPLSPEAQAIKEGFERIGAIHDPRAGMGRIPRSQADSDSDAPPPPRPMGMGIAPGRSADKDAEEPLSPEAQAIADGFKRILGGQPDPRMGYGRIPRASESE